MQELGNKFFALKTAGAGQLPLSSFPSGNVWFGTFKCTSSPRNDVLYVYQRAHSVKRKCQQYSTDLGSTYGSIVHKKKKNTNESALSSQWHSQPGQWQHKIYIHLRQKHWCFVKLRQKLKQLLQKIQRVTNCNAISVKVFLFPFRLGLQASQRSPVTDRQRRPMQVIPVVSTISLGSCSSAIVGRRPAIHRIASPIDSEPPGFRCLCWWQPSLHNDQTEGNQHWWCSLWILAVWERWKCGRKDKTMFIIKSINMRTDA